ncbi:hypothetical protein [Corynebacterium cystitidis]|uniref:hypothetical protein n=1 Tax=Corynebacterium cystitidis TaxID=35757 RepID=UPI00211E46FB|nr:hypothetical protein [Corynebacterium cystitidis]
MSQVVLAAPVAWPHPYGIMRHVGDVLDVSDEERNLLAGLGVIDPGPEAVAADDGGEHQEQGGEPGPEAVADDAEDASDSDPERPPRSANLEAWQNYARTRGVDPKGMKKPDLIAVLT